MISRVRSVGLITGPVAALLLFTALPEQYLSEQGEILALTSSARAAASVGLWMAVWWMTEAISVYATALLPLALFPLTGAASMKQTASSYGHEIIFLFLGGFVLALALERWGLHRRFALNVLAMVGTRPPRIVAAFMGIAASLSMWVTNTATTIMLLPVALSIIGLVSPDEEGNTDTFGPDQHGRRNFGLCLLLGLAYAASIGGIGTIIGTAPNVFIVSFIKTQMGREISFITWMMVGLPLVLAFVPLVWWLLCRVIYPVPTGSIDRMEAALVGIRDQLGPMSRPEKLTLAVFLTTATAWVCRPLLNRLRLGDLEPLAGLTDPGIAIFAALLLFVIPTGSSKDGFLMQWQTAVKLPWGLLLLFGGGLSLAATLDGTGFSQFLGSRVMFLATLPVVAVIAMVTGMMIFLTEMTSNTATTATVIPILYAVALALGLDPYLLIIPAGIAASCAFMLPVATPPNAIVFGSGLVTVPEMSRAGLWLNIIGIVLITILTYAVIIPVLGVIG